MPEGGTKPYSVKNNDDTVPFGEITQKVKDKAHRDSGKSQRGVPVKPVKQTKQGL